MYRAKSLGRNRVEVEDVLSGARGGEMAEVNRVERAAEQAHTGARCHRRRESLRVTGGTSAGL